MLSLSRRKAVAGWERKLLRPLGWVLMSASFTLAIVLLLWGLSGLATG